MTSLSKTATGKNLDSLDTLGKRRLVDNAVLKRRLVVFAKMCCLIVFALLSGAMACQNAHGSTEADRNLLSAASLGDIARVKESLNAGANINIKDDKGQTPLYLATGGGYTSVVQFLMDRGADAGATTSGGANALMAAAFSNYSDIVKLLIARKVGVDLGSPNGFTALMYSAAGGHPEIIRLLLDAGAQINKKTVEGFTALHAAIGGGKTDCVKLLLEKGADPNIIFGNDQKTPLMFSVERGHVDIARLLLLAGADPDLKDKNGRTALEFSNSVAMKKLILPSSKNVRPQQAYEMIRDAIKTGDVDLANLLLTKNVEISRSTMDFALKLAVEEKREEMVIALLSKWNDPASIKVSMWEAYRYRNPNMIRKILKCGVRIDQSIFYDLLKAAAGPFSLGEDPIATRIEIAQVLLSQPDFN